MKVYVLQHTHRVDGEDDVKLLGVYSTRDEGERAITRFSTRPGFAEAPDGYDLDEYDVDTDCWTEGYVTMRVSDD